MKNDTVVKNFDDVVFENRNKAYGAYAIRRSYSENVNRAVMFAMVGAGLIFIIPSIITTSGKDFIETPTTKCPIDWITKLPEIIPIEPQHRVAPPPVRTTHTNLVPIVTTTAITPPIEDTPPTSPTTTGSIEGADTGVDIVQDGEMNIETIAPVSVPAITTPMDAPEVMPEFIGGKEAMMKFLQKKIKYPAAAMRIGIDGTVFVRFVIDKDGNVISAEVIRGIHEALDKEAKRVISLMPAWKAGRQNNNPVAVRMVLPIKFQVE